MQQRLAEIYQYDFVSQSASHGVVRECLGTWKANMPALTPFGLGALTNVETTLCQYYRGVLEVGGVYSINVLPARDHGSSPADLDEILSAFGMV